MESIIKEITSISGWLDLKNKSMTYYCLSLQLIGNFYKDIWKKTTMIGVFVIELFLKRPKNE